MTPSDDAPFTGLTVVVPTRNRADLAAMAVRSVLDQAASMPVSVLLSDNSTDPEQLDALSSLYGDTASGGQPARVVLVRPGRDLPMAEHWEWARAQALRLSGTSHVLYLTDRSVLKSGALERLLQLAHDYPSQVVSFTHDQVNDDLEPVRVEQERWSGRVLRISAQRLLDLAAEMIIVRPLPRALNSLIPVPVLEDLRSRHGSVFESTAPDFCFCFRLLQNVEDVIYVDQALTVMHGLSRSNGNSTTRGVASRDTRDFLRHATAFGGLAAATPLPEVTTTYNVITHELLASRAAAHIARGRPLNQTAYVRTLARETDAFVPGPMRAGNEVTLERAGIKFGRAARIARAAAHYAHFLRVLGVTDFLVQSAHRLGSTSSRPFHDKEDALRWATAGAGRRDRGRSRLRYLKADHLT